MLKGKTVVLGVTGSIAAYKIANLASMLVKKHANVHVIMTENACNFINPITFETLTGNKCLVDTFDRNFQFNVEHVSLAKMADIFLVAPASADVIGKIANGIADDMLTTTIMACKCPKLISPAMNTNMFTNPIVQDNLKKLEHYGYEIIQPDSGYLACGDTGAGKMPSEQVLLNYILRTIAKDKDMAGIKLTVTAGPTREKLDPVRFLSNNSTGKMGYAIAKMAMLRGAEVTLISGKVSLEPVPFVKMVDIVSAEDMYNAVIKSAKDADIIIKAAAVADYRPSDVSDEKIKKNSLQDVQKYITMGLSSNFTIEDYLNRHPDPLLATKLTSIMAQRYHELKASKLDSYEIFDELWTFASGNNSDFSYKAAGLGILTYFFEKCEVFEK